MTMRRYQLLALPVLLACAPGAFAADTDTKVERTATLSASADNVWAMIGDFCDLDDWHPVVARCDLSAKGGTVLRTLTTGDGATLVEALTGTGEMSYTYRILQSPLPVENYTSTLMVESDGDGSKVTWRSDFNATAENSAEVMAGIYDAGLNALAEKLE